ncbi:hypothetical protein [Thalassovita sp.]|uniref:hypothetical protein n=1 Tax=Thalassovita sp. TaxID=1979401 RepID=UPI002B268EAA|nr:hypothetical protein [Thalassovita sp.]
MDEAGQKEGERRVRDLLVRPLKARGLAKPSSLTNAVFEEMLDGLCQRLAYMDAGSLAALEEVAAARPSGKARDRFPIANDLLSMALQIQPPPDDASPLMRKVFAHAVGRRAIDEGWSPELLGYLRRQRAWPSGEYVVKTIRETADRSIRRLSDLEARLGRGGVLSPDEAAWRGHRLAAVEKCREIGRLGQGDAA